jgi:hypothetical protein
MKVTTTRDRCSFGSIRIGLLLAYYFCGVFGDWNLIDEFYVYRFWRLLIRLYYFEDTFYPGPFFFGWKLDDTQSRFFVTKPDG